MRMGAPSSRPSALASETSLWASLSAKAGGSYLPGRNWSIKASNVRRRPTAPWRTACHSANGSMPRLHAHGEGFGERTDDCIPRHVVDELGHGGAADRADIGGLVADSVEHGLVLVENVFVPSYPDRHFRDAAPDGPP